MNQHLRDNACRNLATHVHSGIGSDVAVVLVETARMFLARIWLYIGA
jgi:hypothetical protein